MNTHRIKILNGANNNHIILAVTHDLKFIFFPPLDRFFDQNLVNHAAFNPATGFCFKFFLAVNNRTANPSKSETGTDNAGKTNIFYRRLSLFHVVSKRTFGQIKSNLKAGFLELLAIFSFLDDIILGAEQFNLVFLKDSTLPKFNRQVQPGLPAQSRKNGIRPFFFNYQFKKIYRQRFKISVRRDFRISHDCCRVRINQNNLEPLFPQGFASLGSGIIKLTGLTDNDWPGADQKNFFNVGPFRHGLFYTFP